MGPYWSRNVFDRPADRFGETHSTKRSINLRGERKAFDTTKLPDIEGAVGLLNRESVGGGGRGTETKGRGRGRRRNHRGVGRRVAEGCGGILNG